MSRCDDYCCNYGCNQGRNCPARQACEIPEDGSTRKLARDLLIGFVQAVLIVVGCFVLIAVVLRSVA